jgi:hypothetical protein
VHGRTAAGDVLRVYGPDGATVAEASSPGLADEEVSFDVPAAGTYLIRVEPTDGGTPASADLSLRVSSSSGPGAVAPPTTPLPDMPAISGPSVPFTSAPTLSIVGLSPLPGTLLRDPWCGLFEAVGAQGVCAPHAVSQLAADVAVDPGGRMGLFVIGLLDAGSAPMPVQMDLDAGAGRDSVTSIQFVTGPGTVHLETSTAPAYGVPGITVTRWRVRLCDVPHEGPGGWQYGPCYREVASGDYPLAQLGPGATVHPLPLRPAPDAVLVDPVVGAPTTGEVDSTAPDPEQDETAP